MEEQLTININYTTLVSSTLKAQKPDREQVILMSRETGVGFME